MVGEQVDIFLGGLLAIHLLDAVGEQTAVETDEIRLGQLAYEGGDILVLYIGVGVILRACGCIGSLAIVGEELQFFHRLAVFGVALAIEHKGLCHLIVAFLHQGFLHLILDVLHLDTLMYVEMADDPRY